MEQGNQSPCEDKKISGMQMYEDRWKYYLQFAAINIICIIVLGSLGWWLDTLMQTKVLFRLIALLLSFVGCQIYFIRKIKKKAQS